MTRTWRALGCVLAFLVLTAETCQPAPGTVATIDHAAYNNTPPTADSPRTYASNPSRLLDVYPANTQIGLATVKGTIVFVHGGGFTGGTRGGTGDDPAYFPERELNIDMGVIANQMFQGWNLVSIDYRLMSQPGTVFPAPLRDVVDAINWVKSPASGLQGSKIVVAGGSAGGTLAALVGAYSGTSGASNGLGFSVPTVNGWITVSAPLVDFYGAQANFDVLMAGYGGLRTRGVPAENLYSGSAPGYAIHANRDVYVSADNANGMKDAAALFKAPPVIVDRVDLKNWDPVTQPLQTHGFASEGADANAVNSWFAAR